MDAHIGRMDVRVDLNIEDANMIHLAPKYTKVRRKMGGGVTHQNCYLLDTEH